MGNSDDVLAIRRLAIAYSQSFDSGDVNAWVQLFAPDGIFEAADGSVLRGHDEMRTWFLARPHNGRHTNVDAVVTVDGDEATQRSTAVVYAISGGVLSLRTLAEYSDHLVRSGDSWRFRRRLVRIVASAPE